jgi:hypothetical protein
MGARNGMRLNIVRYANVKPVEDRSYGNAPQDEQELKPATTGKMSLAHFVPPGKVQAKS